MMMHCQNGVPEMGQTGQVLQSWQAVPVVCVCEAQLGQRCQV